jgi:hypothetical protein
MENLSKEQARELGVAAAELLTAIRALRSGSNARRACAQHRLDAMNAILDGGSLEALIPVVGEDVAEDLKRNFKVIQAEERLALLHIESEELNFAAMGPQLDLVHQGLVSLMKGAEGV